MLAIVRIWLGIGAVVVLTAAIALYILARSTAAPTLTVAVAHDAAVGHSVDAAVVTTPAVAVPAPVAIDAAVVFSELQALRASGVAAEVWAQQGSDFLRALDRQCAVECYVAGCGALLTFSSEDAYQHAVDTVAADHTWTGGKKWSTPVRDGDTVKAALVLYRPD
jgi:hypothetical protein